MKEEHLVSTSQNNAVLKVNLTDGKRIGVIDSKTFEEKLMTYFKEADAKNEPYSAYSLAYSLGLTYEQLRDMDGITQSPFTRELKKRALAKCESDASIRLIQGKPPIGLIFYLKNAFNWKDKREEERTFNIRVERVRYSKGKDKLRKKSILPLSLGDDTVA